MLISFFNYINPLFKIYNTLDKFIYMNEDIWIKIYSKNLKET